MMLSVIVSGTEYLGRQITVEIVRQSESFQLLVNFCHVIYTSCPNKKETSGFCLLTLARIDDFCLRDNQNSAESDF